jgi:microsomal dipeptidase-like Zn-dependent dipeptidase
MFDYLKKKFGKKKPAPETKAEPKPKKVEKTAKELATEKGEPYVAVLGMDIDYNNLTYGSFELDWNDKFVSNLIRAGYQGKTDADIVDMWFQNVCRNVVMETFEQEQAIRNSGIYVNTRDIGGGRSEVS